MKAATVHDLKKELADRPHAYLLELCLKLAKFKKENKELLSYLIYEAENEDAYIEAIKSEIDIGFDNINTNSYFYIKKSTRKILRAVKKYIRYSKQKETELALLFYFCQKLRDMEPSIFKNKVLSNMYYRQIQMAKKSLRTLHEDLQFDYIQEFKCLIDPENES